MTTVVVPRPFASVPPLPPATVPRPRLFAALDAAESAALTVVTGSAGTGKSTLVRSWAETRDGDLAWGAFDIGVGTREALWRRILDALTVAGVSGLPDGPIGDTELLLAQLGAALTRHDASVTLVLDDLHGVADPDVRGEVLDLARWQLPFLRLVVTSRSESSVRVQRMQLSGLAWHLPGRDLAFDHEETLALFAAAGVAVDEARVAELRAKTGGWAAGLGLSVLGQRRRAESGTRLPVHDGAVADYLSQEVLAELDPADREFLLLTSVVDDVSGQLADAITGQPGGGARLEALRRRGFPLVTSGTREWYRASPPLVLDFLRAELRRARGGAEVAELHRSAARWLAAHERPGEAFEHALQGNAPDLAAEIVEQHYFALLLTGRLRGVAPSDGDAGEPAWAASPMLGYAVAWSALLQRDVAAGDRWIERSERAAQPTPELAPRVELARLMTLTARGWVTGDLDATRAVYDAMVVALDAAWREIPEGRALRTIAEVNRGAEELWHGDRELGARHIAEGLALGDDAPSMRLLVGANTARASLAAGALALAEEQAEGALSGARDEPWASHEFATVARTVLAAVSLRRSQLGEAAERVAMAVGQPRGPHPLIEADVAFARAEMLRRICRPGKSLAVLDAAEAVLDDVPGATRARGTLAALRGLALLDDGRPEEAAATLEAADAHVGVAVATAVVALARGDRGAADAAVRPWLAAAHGTLDPADAGAVAVAGALSTPDEAEAERLLATAVALAAPESLRSPLDLFASPALTELLRGLSRRGDCHPAFIAALLDEPAPLPEPVALEALSDRELDVLRFLPTALTNHEIAGELFVSANTVKSHLKRIYAKLDVGSRDDAVTRARASGLLPGLH